MRQERAWRHPPAYRCVGQVSGQTEIQKVVGDHRHSQALPSTPQPKSARLVAPARRVMTLRNSRSSARADLIFPAPPYNVPIDGHVCGLGRIRHSEFAMGAGEMSKEAFTAFLQVTLAHAAASCRDGAIAFVCMDWRHMGELLAAGLAVFSELKNLCIWNKSNGGMGSFYRSKHELVFVFKLGSAPHTNTGRYRTNVWDYAGIHTLRPGRVA